MALNRRERELEQALEKAAKALEKFAKSAERAGPGAGGGAMARILPQQQAQGFGQGFQQGFGITGFKKSVAQAGGARAFAGQVAGRAALGGVAAGAAAVGAIGVSLASAGIDSAARGGDFASGAALQGDRLLAKVPFFGEAAKGRVQATEGTIGDLNALTNNLAALGADTDGLRREAAPILRAQQERIFADQQKNANIAERQNRDKSALGQMFNGIHDAFGSAGISGAK